MANRYSERNYEYDRDTEANRARYGRDDYYGSSSERYRTGNQNIGREYRRDYEGYEGDREYDTNRYGRESSHDYGNYGYRARERDYDLGHESESDGYFTGSDYGRGVTGSYGYGNYDRDYEQRRASDYDRDYERGGYGNRNYGSSRYGSSGYGNRSDMNTRYRNRDERDYTTRYGRGSDYERNRNRPDYNYEDRGWWDRTSDEIASWFGDEDAAARRRIDAQMGEHRGRGPRNYKRSDERIKEDVNDRLTYDSFIDASDIDVNVNNGEVVLTGTVANRSAKRYAEDLTEQISGVTNVENRLRVKQQNYNYTESGMTGTTGHENQQIASGLTGTKTVETSESRTAPTGTSATGTPTTGTNPKTRAA